MSSKPKITPKLHFEVGEKVVICDAIIPICGSKYCPDEDDFTFTTIKEVREDGSVVVEEGYVYRQSYETSYGYTDIHNYFRINRVPNDSKTYIFNGKGYKNGRKSGRGYVDKNFNTFLPTYLLKFNQSWQDKADETQRDFEERKKEEEEEHRHEELKKPFYEAYERRVSPARERFRKLQTKAWKEEMCAHCKHNHNGYCTTRKENISKKTGAGCSAFDIPKEGK